MQALLARMFLKGPKVQTAVNACLINTGDKLVLVDTGAAKGFGPTLGYIGDNLKAAGYDAAQVDVVLITHLHGDHVNGLLAPDGSMAFPKAEVWSAQPDNDFWLSLEVAAKAPEGFQPFFKMARKALFARAAREKLLVGGMHLPFPGVGHVRAEGKGYAWVPVEFGPLRD